MQETKTDKTGKGEGKGNMDMLHDPGYTAKMEGIDAEFRDIAQRAVLLYREGQRHAKDGNVTPEDVIKFRADIAEILAPLVGDDDNIDKVFNFVLFLIDEVSARMQRELEVVSKLNELSSVVHEMTAVLGLKPLFQGALRPVYQEEDRTYTTSSGQILVNIHAKESCTGFCVIHDPLPGPWDGWDVVWRGDGLFDTWRGFERICGHGVGHPAAEEVLRGNTHQHGCCGECRCGPGIAEPIIDDETGQLKGYR